MLNRMVHKKSYDHPYISITYTLGIDNCSYIRHTLYIRHKFSSMTPKDAYRINRIILVGARTGKGKTVYFVFFRSCRGGTPFLWAQRKGGKKLFQGAFRPPPACRKGKQKRTGPCAPDSRGVTRCAPHRGSRYKPKICAPARHPSNKGTPLDPVGWKQ